MALGQTEIPAVVLEASQEDCFVMSLVENLARRQHSPLELMREIGELRKRGYSIGADRREDRLQRRVHQRDLLSARTRRRTAARRRRARRHPDRPSRWRSLAPRTATCRRLLPRRTSRRRFPGNQVLAIRRIIEQRNVKGKGMEQAARGAAQAKETRHRRLAGPRLPQGDRAPEAAGQEGNHSQSRLLFVVNALRRLFADEHFVTLLRAEAPAHAAPPLAERLGVSQRLIMSEPVRIAFERSIAVLPLSHCCR